MEKFNKYKHTSLITKWWLEDSKLSALLKIDRGYKLPSDWIKDLEDSNAFIFNNGIGEIRDILLGQKTKEAEIFYYSPDFKAETNIAGQIIGWCLSREINKIRIKRLDVKEDIVTKELINALVRTGVNQYEKMDNKNTNIPIVDTIGTAYTEPASEKLSTGSNSDTTTDTAISTISNTIVPASKGTGDTSDTNTETNSTNATSEKPSNDNISTKKPSLKRKKKQSSRLTEQATH